MISPTKTAENVILDGLPGERRQFTMKATGKAFRILIDGLYENKIGAVVREIISNGYDSHAAAGRDDLPLFITAPTSLDPTFRVRDVGVSMTDETIMGLYTTIFDSTKEDTNDQVGQFGLGSKSPFAYTDTFSVTAFLAGEKRVYVANIENDIPQITHLITEPQGDELDGIEVTIPVKPNDVFKFHEEITKMILGSDVRPDVEGLGKSVPKPVAEGDGWRVIRDIYHWGRVAIRQGCVIYPVHSRSIESVAYGFTTIIDVPIGSVDVTASREALSMTPETVKNIDLAIHQTCDKIGAYIKEIEAGFKNRLEAFQGRNEHEWLATRIGRNTINLMPDKRASALLPATQPEFLRTQRKVITKTSFDRTDNIMVIVDDPAINKSIPRRKARIAAFYSGHQARQILLVTRRDLPRLVRLLGLKSSQVISVAALPDIPIIRNATGGVSNAGKYSAPKKFPAGKYWVRKTGIKSIDWDFGGHYARHSDELFAGYRGVVFNALGFQKDDVVFLTDRQADALKAPADQEFTNAIRKAVAKYAATHGTVAKYNKFVKDNTLRKESDSTKIFSRIRGQYGLSWGDDIGLTIAGRVSDELRAKYVKPVVDPPTDIEYYVASVLELSDEFDLQKFGWESKVDEAMKIYTPLLSNGASVDFLIDFYTTTQEATQK